MPDIENIKSVRLSPEKAKDFDELGIPAKELFEEAITKKKTENQFHSKKQLVNKLITNGVYAIIGLALLSALNLSSNLFAIAIIGGMGALFCAVGFYHLYLTIKEVNLYNRK